MMSVLGGTKEFMRMLTESKHSAGQPAAGERDGEDYATIPIPDTSGYQVLEMSRR